MIKNNNYYNESEKLYNLAETHYNNSRWTEAIECYNKALDLYKNIGNKVKEVERLNSIGLSYRNLNSARPGNSFQGGQ
ncbi:tetratricopeptide repeat protein [candidate division KSB1 bacterium]|nr:tetratricopeptide repeat protein [candidate division KSB1 bacterium]